MSDHGTGRAGASRDVTKASWELPVANMAWATPRRATTPLRTAAASSAAAAAMASVEARTATSAPRMAAL